MMLRFPANIIAGLLAAALVPVVVVGVSVLVATQATALPGDAAFRAGDTVVTTAELRHRVRLLRALYGVSAPPDARQQDLFRRQTAEAVALSTVLDRAARDEGTLATEPEAKAILGKMISDRFPDGRTGFARLLGEVGASEPDVLDEIKRQQATSRLFTKIVGSQAEVSEEQARGYYDTHPGEFLRPEARRLCNIVVASAGDAEQVTQQARAGIEFVELARRYSLDQATRDAGGDLGVLARQQLEQDYATAAFGAPVGGVFGPVRTQHGWNVGQVLEVHPATRPPFDQVKESVRRELASRRASEVWNAWVAERVRAAHIEYADTYHPGVPEVRQPDATARR